MLSKFQLVENSILRDISRGLYPPKHNIPSRNRLMAKYKCSRTTVERAVASLVKQGYLGCRKGSSTFVLEKTPSTHVRSLYIVLPSRLQSIDNPYQELLLPEDDLGIPVTWINMLRVADSIEQLAAQGSAVVWLMPSEEQTFLMSYLRNRRIPQLIFNREYQGYDCVLTDSKNSIREGLSWLMIEAGRDIAFITLSPNSERPYLYQRVIAFYEVAVELGAHLHPDTVFSVAPGNYSEISMEISNIATKLFNRDDPPRGVFVLHRDLTLPLVLAGQVYGKQPGKNYSLLVFDDMPELKAYPGTAMMRQPYHLWGRELKHWLENCMKKTNQPIKHALKTELILPQK